MLNNYESLFMVFGVRSFFSVGKRTNAAITSLKYPCPLTEISPLPSLLSLFIIIDTTCQKAAVVLHCETYDNAYETTLQHRLPPLRCPHRVHHYDESSYAVYRQHRIVDAHRHRVCHTLPRMSLATQLLRGGVPCPGECGARGITIAYGPISKK